MKYATCRTAAFRRPRPASSNEMTRQTTRSGVTKTAAKYEMCNRLSRYRKSCATVM